MTLSRQEAKDAPISSARENSWHWDDEPARSTAGGESAESYLGSLVESLRGRPSVSSAVLIGSFARGDFTAASDIDVLVVTKIEIRGRALTKALPESQLNQRLALLQYSEMIFKLKYRNGDRFLRNVVEDGKVLYDDGFYERLTHESPPVPRDSPMLEIEGAKKYLRMYATPKVFNRKYMGCLPTIRYLSINVMMAAVELAGRHESSKRGAIERFVQLYPELEVEVRKLSRIGSCRTETAASRSEATEGIMGLERLLQGVERGAR